MKIFAGVCCKELWIGRKQEAEIFVCNVLFLPSLAVNKPGYSARSLSISSIIRGITANVALEEEAFCPCLLSYYVFKVFLYGY